MKPRKHSINLGIIGCGYWGPNLIRNFSSLPNCNVKKVSDLKPGRLEYIKKEFPFVQTTKNFRDILRDKTIDAVCIATPTTTHRNLAEEALASGKHTFVEKPLAFNSEEAKFIVELASKLKKKLAVGHVFQYAPAVRKIKSLLEARTIGKVLHISSTRINLGPPNSEVDVIWDLGPHDFSIILYLLEETPWKVECIRNSFPFNSHPKQSLEKSPCLNPTGTSLTNNAHIDLKFKSNITAHIHLSWLSSNKMRFMQIFGTKGTIIYDEMLALDGKVKLYGQGVDNRINVPKAGKATKLVYHAGDIRILPLEQHEPLRKECEEFVNSILYDKPLVNDGRMGLEVVKLLETSSESFKPHI